MADFGVSTHLFHEHRLTRDHLVHIAAHGFETVELFATRAHFDYHDDHARAQLAEWLSDTRLQLHSVHAPAFEALRHGRWVGALSNASSDESRRKAALAEAAQARGLSVMVFTGHMLEDALRMGSDVESLLAHTDILVDGPYVRELPDTSRRWIGSTNQRIHFLTERYRADDPCWQQRNTLEIRVRGNEISVNGFPAKQAVGLWKRPEKTRHPPQRHGDHTGIQRAEFVSG